MNRSPQALKQFSDILTESYVGAGEKTTHVSMGDRKGRYYVSSGVKGEQFMNSYCDAIYQGDEKVASIGIAESPLSDMGYSPVRVDIDIDKTWKKDGLPEGNIYTDDQVRSLVSIYYKVLNDLIIGGIKERDQVCVYLSKDGPKRRNPDVISQGFHLHFPHIYVRNGDQMAYICPMINKEVDAVGLFDNIVESSVSSSKCLDCRAGISTPWLMYGSGKGDGRFYKLTNIFDGNMDELSIKDLLTSVALKDDDGELIEITKNAEWYIPMILSINPVNKDIYNLAHNAYKPSIYKGKKKNYKPKNPELIFDQSERIQQEIKMMKELMPMLSHDRTEDWENWTQVGIYMFNICNGTDEGFDVWYEFSQKAEMARVATLEECKKVWNGFYSMDIDIRALENLVKHDNLEGFRKYQQRNSHRCLLYLVSVKHYDVAKSLHELYPDDFVYTKDRTWYVFNNHGWEYAPEGMALRKLLSTELYDNHKELLNKIKSEMKAPGVSEQRLEALMLACENIQKVLTSLKTTAFKSNVIKECTEIYYDPYFLNKLDNNPDLIRFSNGVMDLDKGHLRTGVPSDYLSKCTNTEWTDFASRDPRVCIVRSYVAQVFPDPELMEYFLNSTSEFWRGFNFRKIFGVWTGAGDNSKSVMMSLIEKMLGEYMIKLPTSLITGKRTQSSAASPEMIRCKGTKLCVLQEPSKTDHLNAGVIKELTGNDSFYCRGLFSEGIEITPLFKLVMICNELPINSDNDPAFWNRNRVIPFEATFSSDAPTDLQEQIRQKKFPKDPNFIKKLEQMIEPFTYLLITRYLKIRNKDYNEPHKVTSATETYKKNNDVYLQFIDENTIQDTENILNIQTLYSNFKEWFKESVPNGTIPSKSEVAKQMNNKWKKQAVNIRKTSWSGVRLRTPQDEMEENNRYKNGDTDITADEKKQEEKKEYIVRPNSITNRTEVINGQTITSKWLIGNDKEFVGKISGNSNDLLLLTDRVKNEITDGIVVDNDTGLDIGKVMGEGVYSYISYYNDKRDDLAQSSRKKKTIRSNNQIPTWGGDDKVECTDIDCTVDSSIRSKIKKSVKSMMGKDDDGGDIKKNNKKIKVAVPRENEFGERFEEKAYDSMNLNSSPMFNINSEMCSENDDGEEEVVYSEEDVYGVEEDGEEEDGEEQDVYGEEEDGEE
jgi:P4 family phage/plasmid primase-like protien